MNFLTHYFHLISLPPIIPITSAFILGIIIQATNISLPESALIALFICTLYCAFKKHTAFYGMHYYVLYFLIAASGAYLYKKNIHDYTQFYNFTQDCAVDITGTIVDKNTHANAYSQSIVITLAIDFISKNSCIEKYKKNIVFYCTQSADLINVGDIVCFHNVHCKKPDNESFSHYQIKEQIAATIFDQNVHYSIIYSPQWSLRRLIFNQKKRILSVMQQKLSPPCFIFFTSLFLGNRACVKNTMEKYNDQFKQWGIYHLLARSGIHLALFIFAWQALLNALPVSLTIKQLIIVLLSCIYYILSWASTPFIRSFALFMLNKTCMMTKNSYHLLHYLALTCLCFLIYCPLHLFFLDFQLSFALTFALAWLSELYSQSLYTEQTKQ